MKTITRAETLYAEDADELERRLDEVLLQIASFRDRAAGMGRAERRRTASRDLAELTGIYLAFARAVED